MSLWDVFSQTTTVGLKPVALPYVQLNYVVKLCSYVQLKIQGRFETYGV